MSNASDELAEDADVEAIEVDTDDDDLDDLDASADTAAVDDLDDDDDDAVAAEPAAGTAPTAMRVLTYLVKALVEDPSAVDVDLTEGRRGIELAVRVAPQDMGRVIGKRGRTANAIRAIVRAAASKDGVDVDVDFVD